METIGKEADLWPVGNVARDLRRKRGMTLDELSAKSEISKGHLSRFERGFKSLSLASLIRLAAALETSVGVLLGEKTDHRIVRIARNTERNAANAMVGEASYRFWPISGAQQDGRPYSAFIVSLDENEKRKSSAYHAGLELLYVLSGSLKMTLEDQSIALSEGDFIEFPGNLRHEISSESDQSRILLIVLDDR